MVFHQIYKIVRMVWLTELNFKFASYSNLFLEKQWKAILCK